MTSNVRRSSKAALCRCNLQGNSDVEACGTVWCVDSLRRLPQGIHSGLSLGLPHSVTDHEGFFIPKGAVRREPVLISSYQYSAWKHVMQC